MRRQERFCGRPFGAAALLGACLGCFLLLPAELAGAEAQFLRGDVNQDGRVSMADALLIRRFLFEWQDPATHVVPACMDAADTNDDGRVDIADTIRLVVAVFGEFSILPEPYPLPGDDPTLDALSCESYDVVPADETTDVIRIGAATAAPGGEARIPVYVTSSVPVEAFQIVIEADSPLFSVYEGSARGGPGDDTLGLNYEGTLIEELMLAHQDPDMNWGLGWPDWSHVGVFEEGNAFVVSVLLSFFPGVIIPPQPDELLLCRIAGRVAEDAPDGAVIQLYPTNGPGGEGLGPYFLRNELCYRGEARYASVLPQRLEGGLLEIKSSPDTLDFLRADANGDGTFDLADPIFVISYLFGRGPEPECADAADMNDDGTLDVADAIFGLTYLFCGAEAVAGTLTAPIGCCAPDETPDSLPPCYYEHCTAE